MDDSYKTTEDRPFFNSKREQRVVFFLVFIGVITLTYGLLYIIDFLPERPADSFGTEEEKTAAQYKVREDPAEVPESSVEGIEDSEQPVDTIIGEEAKAFQDLTFVSDSEDMADIGGIAEAHEDSKPIAIIFDSLNREVSVMNPESRSVATLDQALLSGVVRHPDSADFATEGTIFLFGHSSYLPVVINKNFQAFNGIQDLVWGDTVRLQSPEKEYVYRVDRVYQVKASDAEVAIERGEAKLTLATCNSFGSKDDRYVVEATLVDSYVL